MQNREAQRRFRERKESRQQTLEQRAAELEEKCQELSEGFRQKSEEVTRILQEKEVLTGEIQDLRKRWRLMVMLLQRPNGLQSLSSLLASDSSSSSSPSTPSPSSSGSGSSSAPSPAPSPAPPATEAAPLDAPLDELLGCLHALLVPNETPHSSSSASSS
jgi:TolA-binding protein